MVEVVGVEPTSEKRNPEASTCVSFYPGLAAARWKKADLARKPASKYPDATRGRRTH